jgi:L-iditol 2-dehydrogenase
MPVQAGETVVVLGLGPIGLLFVRMCRLAGARVLAVGRRAERLALASRLGADEVLDERDLKDVVSAVRAHTEGGRGADKVIEAVGTPAAWETAIALARKAGTVSLFGGCPAGTSICIDTHRIHYEELTLLGTFHHTPQAVRKALQLIAEGAIPAREFIGGHVRLPALPEILAAFARGTLDTVKIAVMP